MGKNKIIKRLNGTVVVMAIAVVVVTVLVLATLLTSNNAMPENKNTARYTDPTTGLTIDYRSDLEIAANSTPQEGVLFNLAKSDPRMQITSWLEEGDSIARLNILDKPLNQLMIYNAKKQINDIYSDVKITDEKLVTINGLEGGEVVFNYTSSGGIKTTQRLLVLVKDTDTVITIAAQAYQERYDEVNKDYFDQIMSSAKF